MVKTWAMAETEDKFQQLFAFMREMNKKMDEGQGKKNKMMEEGEEEMKKSQEKKLEGVQASILYVVYVINIKVGAIAKKVEKMKNKF